MNLNRKKTVLVADDDPDCLDLLTRILESLGLEVRTANNGKEALASVLESQPDLLCLDAMMPVVDGFTVCEVLALDDDASQIPVIIITGRKDQKTIDRCRDMCAYYINKSARLRQAIESVVGELLDVNPIAFRNPQRSS